MFNTSYVMYLAVLGSLIHAYSIPAAVEVAQRKKGFVHGLFQWLIKAPWGEPGFAALVVSMSIFGFIGGVSGVIQGQEQINMIVHNTLRVPGHFHATVVGGTTLAFMGLSYYVVPLMTCKQLVLRKWAQWQPYIFGFGITLVALGMLWAGIEGEPRRTAASVLPGSALTLSIMGVGALIAVTGLLMFVIIAVSTLLRGKKLPGAA
jgi:cytochrome c oxidase subunit I